MASKITRRGYNDFMARFIVIIVLLLSLFGIFDLFAPGYYSSHDGVGHVIRMDEFYKAFDDGQFPVRWSKRLYFGYGYPFFNFNYPSVYYFGLPLMKAGFSATDAMKSETVFAFVLSGALMYLYLKKKVKLPYAILGAILYLYAPYRMSNIYVRGSVAENFAFIFPPLLLWGGELLASNSKKSILYMSLVIGLMGISHNISALLLSAFFFGYLIFLSVSHRSFWPLIKGGISFVIGILMAGFFMIPALFEKKWTFLDLTIARDYPDHFVYLPQLVDPRWGFGGSVAGKNDGMSFSLGLIQLGLTFLALFSLKKKNLLLTFSLLIILVSIFFMLGPSKIFWDRIPLLPFVQFPWRFTMLTVPATAIAGALGTNFIFEKFKSKTVHLIILILVAGTILSASYMWHRNQTENVRNVAGDALEGSTTWAHEQATRWFVPKPDRIPDQKVESVEGPLNYTLSSWKTIEHTYTVSVKKDIQVVENTMYYPGWETFVDGKKVGIDFQNQRFPGRLVFAVSAGHHQIVSKLGETPLRKTLDVLSAVILLAVVLYLLGNPILKVFSQH